MKRFWVIGVLVLCAGLIGTQAVKVTGAPKRAAAENAIAVRDRKPAANFQMIDVFGKQVRLNALRGKVVLLDFWATWCPPCRAEIPHFNKLYRKYRSQGFEIIGVSLDKGGPEVVRPFAKENKMRYPLVMGDTKITQDYGGIRGIPTTFLIDKKGRIAYKYVGFTEAWKFERAISALLSE